MYYPRALLAAIAGGSIPFPLNTTRNSLKYEPISSIWAGHLHKWLVSERGFSFATCAALFRNILDIHTEYASISWRLYHIVRKTGASSNKLVARLAIVNAPGTRISCRMSDGALCGGTVTRYFIIAAR